MTGPAILAGAQSSRVEAAAPPSLANASTTSRVLERYLNIADLRHASRKRLPRGVFEFFDRGSEDELSLAGNREAFARIKLRNKVLVDVSQRTTAASLFGKPLSMPLAIAPTGVAGVCKEIVVSALGLREGLLYDRLSEADKKSDPLIVAARDLNVLRSRAPGHGEDLCLWTDAFMKSTHLEETVDDKRLRHAACLLSDIGWRAHPDYRGEQSLNIIANAAFVSIDHAGRAFLALSASYRHMSADHNVSPHLRTLATARMLDRAHILGAATRVAYAITAAMPNVLPRTPLRCSKGKLILKVAKDFAPLANDRLASRLKSLARLIGREPEIKIV